MSALHEVKTILAIAIIGLWGSVSTGPILSDVSPVDMPWFAQFGLCGLFASMLFWAIAKTIPQVSKDAKDSQIKVAETHAASQDKLCDTINCLGETFTRGMEGVRSEVRAGNDSQLALLRNVLAHKHLSDGGEQHRHDEGEEE